jgi:hypothetical protein
MRGCYVIWKKLKQCQRYNLGFFSSVFELRGFCSSELLFLLLFVSLLSRSLLSCSSESSRLPLLLVLLLS